MKKELAEMELQDLWNLFSSEIIKCLLNEDSANVDDLILFFEVLDGRIVEEVNGVNKVVRAGQWCINDYVEDNIQTRPKLGIIFVGGKQYNLNSVRLDVNLRRAKMIRWIEDNLEEKDIFPAVDND